MINLLPPQVKAEITYSRRNTVMLRYLGMTIIVAIVAAGMFWYGHQLAKDLTGQADERTSSKELTIASFSKLEANAATLNARLTSISTIQKNQAKFSVLLADLAQYMPQGTSVSSITLTGEDNKPVRLTVGATDYKTALSFRDSITRSKRISAADIESINEQTTPGNGAFQVVVTFTFSPGGSR